MEIFELIITIVNLITSIALLYVVVKYIGKQNGKK